MTPLTSAALHDRAASLRSDRVPFVHAVVVLAERPTSAKPGDEALVLPDGSLEGFVGGSCAESTVRSHGLALLQRGESVLLRIAPVAEPEQPGKTVVHNPCLSGGTLEIFLEPVLPPPLVRVLGDSPIARAMATVGAALGYAVEYGVPDGADALAHTDAVVVAAHGLADEAGAIRAAVAAGVPYVGLIASRKRGAAVVAEAGLPEEAAARVHTPAGLDIGARGPAEIALSVFAEMVSVRPRPARPQPATETPVATGAPVDVAEFPLAPTTVLLPMVEAATAVDPVCGMSVAAVDATPHSDVTGSRVWFCCPGCKRAFEKDPTQYGPAS